MSVADLDCALVPADARVHAIARVTDKPTPLCGTVGPTLRVDAPFEADDELACIGCVDAALKLPIAG